MKTIVKHHTWYRQTLLASFAIICSLIAYFLLPEGYSEPEKRVVGVLIFAIFFWGFEIIPLYATSLLIVLLLTFLLTSPFDILGVGKQSLQLFLIPFASPIIMLFLGGLVLAAAAHKHQVDIFLMEKMLTKLGRRSHVFLGGMLGISAFFSMWISNTAATAMLLMLVQPILEGHKHDNSFKKSIVLAIAFGANIGGIATPIGTPPNAIAMGILKDYGVSIDFISWMLMAVPLMIILLIIAAGILLFLFPSHTKKISLTTLDKPRLSFKGHAVIILALSMILLWLTTPFHGIPEELVALLGVGLFAAFQLITTKEMRSIPWDVLILMWGGLALGEAVQRSDLVEELSRIPFFSQSGVALIIIFSFLAILLTAFISNTATANLLLPLALSIDPTNKTLLSVTVALACSFSFALPISTPPNALAYATGLFSVKDMFKAGAILAIIAWLIMLAGFQYIIPWAFS